ncbi:MAG: response regulator [Chloroflexota bacterium]
MNGRSTILVVDDDSCIRGLLASWLEDAGYRVIVAADGLQALEQTRRDTPNLILLDLSMPKLDGYSVIRTLRQRLDGFNLPIIAISADIRAPQNLRGLGVDGFLSKPFDLDEVLARAKAALALRPETLPAAV